MNDDKELQLWFEATMKRAASYRARLAMAAKSGDVPLVRDGTKRAAGTPGEEIVELRQRASKLARWQPAPADDAADADFLRAVFNLPF